MKHDTILRDGIRGCLNAMQRILQQAQSETSDACGHIAGNEQNLAIGTLIVVEDQLEQAIALYKAVIAMHRCKL